MVSFCSQICKFLLLFLKAGKGLHHKKHLLIVLVHVFVVVVQTAPSVDGAFTWPEKWLPGVGRE